MEYNNYNQPYSDRIICPHVTVWIVFGLSLFIIFYPYTISFLIILIQLIISLNISIGINNKNYNTYKVGLYLSLCFNILVTIGIAVFVYLVIVEHAKGLIVRFVLSILAFAGSVIWIQFFILLCYKNRVKNLSDTLVQIPNSLNT